MAAEAKARALEELAAARSKIQVRSLMELRARQDVPVGVQAAARAAIQLIAGLDGEDGFPRPLTWEGAQAALLKPGRLLDLFSRFSWAADAVGAKRAAVLQNLQPAAECLQIAAKEDLTSEPLGENLARWALAAVMYLEAVDDGSAGASPQVQSSLQQQKAQQSQQQPQATKPSSPKSPSPKSPSPKPSTQKPPSPTQSTKSPFSPTRGAQSASPLAPVRATSPLAASSPASTQPRRGVGGSPPPSERVRDAGTTGRAAQTAPAARVPTRVAVPRLGLNTKPPRSFVASSRSHPMGGDGQVIGIAGGGYPEPGPKMKVQDYRNKLDQVRRETMEMKALEAKMKLEMERERREQRNAEKQQALTDITTWRQQEAKDTSAYIQKRKQATQQKELQENLEHQRTKRVNKQNAKADDLTRISDAYMEQKEDSERRIEELKMVFPREQHEAVTENLLKYQTMAVYKESEKHRELQDHRDFHDALEAAEMRRRMDDAEKAKQVALYDLEHIREHHSTNSQLRARPTA